MESNERAAGPDAAISVEGICKNYRLGVINRGTFRDELLYRWHRLRGRDPRTRMGRIGDRRLEGNGWFHALDRVSFSVAPGEAVGLIGRNGAGKSTMLKILARITAPDAGRAVIRGRVGSLLEVGTGFHPELTGRENVFMNGTILGMRRREIAAKFDEIAEFSEIGDFLDTPVKRYSSGMYVKLAFSVATSLDTDVLLVDEVLAVGDANFQRKSLERMNAIAASGRTILFVSHSLPAVRQLCRRCIWFDEGRVREEGPTDVVAEAYLSKTARAETGGPLVSRTDRDGDGGVRAVALGFAFDETRDSWTATLDYRTAGGRPWKAPRAALCIRHMGARGVPLAVFDSGCSGGLPDEAPAEGRLRLSFPRDVRLPADDFAVDCRLWSGDRVGDDVSEAAVLTVPGPLATPDWALPPFRAGEFNFRHQWGLA